MIGVAVLKFRFLHNARLLQMLEQKVTYSYKNFKIVLYMRKLPK